LNNKKYKAEPRAMENGDIAIPYSVCFVMNKLMKFDPMDCSMKVRMTLVLRIKLRGLPNMKIVWECIKLNLMIKINDEKDAFINNISRYGTIKETNS